MDAEHDMSLSAVIWSAPLSGLLLSSNPPGCTALHLQNRHALAEQMQRDQPLIVQLLRLSHTVLRLLLASNGANSLAERQLRGSRICRWAAAATSNLGCRHCKSGLLATTALGIPAWAADCRMTRHHNAGRVLRPPLPLMESTGAAPRGRRHDSCESALRLVLSNWLG